MNRRSACAVVLLCCILLIACVAGCGGVKADESAIAVDWTVEPDPPRVGPATFTLALADSAGHPVVGADVKVEGNMAHAGMRPVFADATEADSGRYAATLEFTMAGDWFLLVDVTLPDGATIERTIEVRGVQPQ